MRALFTAVAAIVLASVLPGRAADLCEAVALRDVAAIGNPEAILKRGARDEAVTQFRVNKKTGLTSFCSHGGSCYPTHVVESGRKVEALRLTNCKVGARDAFDDPDEIFYSVDVIRSKVPPKKLAVDDADNKLLDLGMCSACAGNAAYLYINQPSSRCATLVGRALKGDAAAVERLKADSDVCSH